MATLLLLLGEAFHFSPALLNTVDFISPDGKCQFRTSPQEKDRVVFQMVGKLYLENVRCTWPHGDLAYGSTVGPFIKASPK